MLNVERDKYGGVSTASVLVEEGSKSGDGERSGITEQEGDVHNL